MDSFSASGSFPSTTRAAWEAQVQRELKGQDADLTWQPDPFLHLAPYYTAEDAQAVPAAAIRAAQRTATGWEYRALIPVSTEEDARLAALAALQEGATALEFVLSSQPVQLTRLLQGLKPSDTPLYFSGAADYLELADALGRLFPFQWKGGFGSLPAGDLSGYEAGLLHKTAGSPGFRTFRFRLETHASPVERLGAFLLDFVRWLDRLTDAGLDAGLLFRKTEITIDLSPSFYLEIATIRALRYLTSLVADGYGVSERLFIHGVPAAPVPAAGSESFDDLLRAGSESVAGIIGGLDALSILQSEDVFSRRIGTNISNLLREESHLGRVADPAAGSWFLEKLTWEIARNAWEYFLSGLAGGD